MKRDVLLLLTIVAGLTGAALIARWSDKHREDVSPRFAEEQLYLGGSTAKRASLAFSGLAADWYWMRSLQYVGRKLVNYEDTHVDQFELTSLNVLDLRLLPSLLRMSTTLDPQFMAPYEYGAVILPTFNDEEAIALLNFGISANPNEWRLYQHLGYIYWQAGNQTSGDERAADYAKAGEWYERGSKVPGAMWWMRDLAGYMKIAGGSREAAYAIYSTYLNSDDENIRKQAALRMKQLRALGEMDAINELLTRYKAQTGQCPTDLRQFAPQLRAMKLTLNDEQQPVDPDGVAYELKIEKCKVELAWESQIPR